MRITAKTTVVWDSEATLSCSKLKEKKISRIPYCELVSDTLT